MNKEVDELLNKLGSMEDAPLIWINRKVIENEKRIKEAIKYNKELSELYDEGSMEHSNAITNLLILGDKETTKILKGEINE